VRRGEYAAQQNILTMRDDIERLLLQNFNRLGRLALYLTSNPQDAQDLLQETAVRVLLNGKRFELGTDFNAWSSRIMTNLFISHVNTKRRRHELGKQGNILNKLYGGMDRVFNNGEWLIFLGDVDDGMKKLDEKSRLSLQMLSEGYTYDEIAVKSGENLGTVKSRVHFSRRKMRSMVREELPERTVFY